MSEFIDSFKSEFVKIIDHYKKELSALRIGRATPAVLENLTVNAYETPTPLMQLASIQSPEPKSLVVQPWDKNLVKQIAKAITDADLGVGVSAEDQLVRVNFPPMTEETRKEVTKKLHQKMEEARVGVRSQREKIKEEIIRQERDKVMTEDERYKRLEELDKLVKDYNELIKDLGDKKAAAIMTV